jgi:heme O synthase-like polyprenyltransferase
MQGIYTYIPETNHVPRENRVAAILVLLFMVLISLVPALTPLYFYVSMCTVLIIIIIIIKLLSESKRRSTYMTSVFCLSFFYIWE